MHYKLISLLITRAEKRQLARFCETYYKTKNIVEINFYFLKIHDYRTDFLEAKSFELPQ